jgi:hypothetical protein
MPSVLIIDNTYHMWYTGNSPSPVGSIGYSSSADGINWTKYAGSIQDWDYPYLRASQVIHDGSKYNMFYVAGVHPNYDIGYAYSEDGTNWTKYPNPVMLKGPAESWDSGGLFTGTVLFNDSRDSLRMWYGGGSGGTTTGRIGYATAPLNPTGIDATFNALTKGFILSQNFPNPFNPATMINYQLPKASKVELSVYNLLGQKVTILVSEKQQAGQYQVTWDATGYVRGVYFYQLKTDKGFVKTRRLILLR